jgi:hypothetical protein
MKYSLFLFLFLIFSCNKKNKFEYESSVLSKINSIYYKDSILTKKVYLVTGLDGCGACLEYTVKFIENKIKDPNMAFIISGKSRVQLKSKFKIQTIENDNFLFDTSQIALRKGLVEMAHPRVFLCKSGKVYDVKEIDYINADSVFTYVKDFIKK